MKRLKILTLSIIALTASAIDLRSSVFALMSIVALAHTEFALAAHADSSDGDQPVSIVIHRRTKTLDMFENGRQTPVLG